MAKPDYDLCVIGGGSGGLTAAGGGAVLGARVALVEAHALGGDCLYSGCVPSKALLHVARMAARGGPAASVSQAMNQVAHVIQTIEPHDSPERFRGLGIDVIFGKGQFVDRQTFQVDGRAITSRRFVVATGSRAALPQLPGLDSIPYLTNETVFHLHENVPHLVVLGGGPVGVELSQAFRRLGSRATLVEQGAEILPHEDRDLVHVVRERLGGEGVEFLLGASAIRVEGAPGDIRLTVKDANGCERVVAGSHLLVATGRRANVEGLSLDAAGVLVEKGRIVTDSHMRTANRRIYAVGDVTSAQRFTHVAEHEAGVVLRHALFHLPARRETQVIPWCTFTDPELARVGLSESEATARGIPHQAYIFPFSEIDRAVTDDECVGFAKIVIGKRGRLLGAAIVGAAAGELIHEYALALSQNLKFGDISKVIHVYPTLAQINRRVADAAGKAQLTPRSRKWLQRLFGLRGT